MIQGREWNIYSTDELFEILSKNNINLHFAFPASIKENLIHDKEKFRTKILHIGKLSQSIINLEELVTDLEEDDLFSSDPNIFSFGSYPEIRKQIGQNMKQQLASLGLTQKEAAQMLGITDSAMSQIINGQISIKVDDLLMIQKKLNVKAEDLIKNVEWDEGHNVIVPSTPVQKQHDLTDFKKILTDLIEQFDETELKSILRKVDKITREINPENMQGVIDELHALVKQSIQHQSDKDKGFEVDDYFMESYRYILQQIRKTLSAYPAGITSTLKEISDHLDFLITRNKKQKRAD